MARAKDDLSKITLNQIEKLTGSTFRSITKYLDEAKIEPVEVTDNCKYYDPKAALPVIFESQGHRTKKSPAFDPEASEEEIKKCLDPFVQRARKDRAQADKAEFELEVLKKNFVPAVEIESVWAGVLTNFRVKVLGIAATETPTLFRIKDMKEFQTKLYEVMRSLLEELSSYDPDANDEDNDVGDNEESVPESNAESSPTDHDDGVGVGSEV